LPVLVFLLFLKKLKSGNNVVIAIALYSSIFFTFLNFDEYLSTHYRHVYTTTYTLLEYLFFTYIIGNIIQNKKSRFALLLLSILFIVFQIIYYFKAKFKTIDSVPIGIESILIFTYIIILFYEQFQRTRTQYIYSNPWFGIIIGIMVYLSCSFFFNIMASNIDTKALSQYWFLTWIFETIKNTLFAISIIMYSRKPDKSSQQHSSSVPYLDMI
jgi:hypothetical protein